MPFSATPKSLIVYSSPERLDRLRLDEEHRAIDQVLAKHHLPVWVIRRIHAATLLDFGFALRERDFEVVQFSCHGDEQGLYFEGKGAREVTPWKVLSQTLQGAAPSLCVVILNACYSAAAEQALHDAAPFLILMSGSAQDEAAIIFSQHFFDEYYRSGAVEQAFRQATWALESLGFADALKPLLTRRQPSGESVVQACFSRRQDSIFINLAEAEQSISLLPISRHEFLALLTRKIRVHSWIYRVERERAVIPIGQFFGVFSWSNAKDVVICHEVLQLRENAIIQDCMGWTRLMVIYNDLRSERYRGMSDPAAVENKVILNDALRSVRACDQYTLCADDVAPAAQKLAPHQYVVTLSTVRVQCDFAQTSLERDDLPRVVIALETAISSIHDLVNELTAAVTIPRPT